MTQEHAPTPPPYRFWGSVKPTHTGVAAKAAGGVAQMQLYDPVDSFGAPFGVSAKEFSQALADLPDDVSTIELHVNSPGGEVFDGLAILNQLRQHPATVNVVVDGLAASVASVIAMAGDRVEMAPNSQMMVHDASGLVIGNAKDMADFAATLDKISQNIASVYADRTGGSADDWRTVMQAETWYTADEAVEAGLADRVTPKPADDKATNRFDLSIFNYAGREHAPAPATPQPPTASADGSVTTQRGESAVAFSDEQMTTMRQELGLPEDADEATIVAALSEALAEQAEATTSHTTTAQAPEGMTLVDTAVLDELRSGARQGVEARQRQLTEDRDRTIEDAIRTGRTTPARREHWQNAWAADPEGTRQMLASLAPGLVPVEELGNAGDPASAQNNADDSLYVSLFGDEQKGA